VCADVVSGHLPSVRNGAVAEGGLNQMDRRSVVQGVAQPVRADRVHHPSLFRRPAHDYADAPVVQELSASGGKTGCSAPAFPRTPVNSAHSGAVRAMDRVRPFLPNTVIWPESLAAARCAKAARKPRKPAIQRHKAAVTGPDRVVLRPFPPGCVSL